MLNSTYKRLIYLLDREESSILTDEERMELEQLQHKLDKAEMQTLAPTLQAMDAHIERLNNIELSLIVEQEKLKKELSQAKEALGQFMSENQKLRERQNNLLNERNQLQQVLSG